METAPAEINALETSRAVGSTDEPFSVDIGLPTNNQHSVSPQQEVRPNSAAYPLQFVNSLYGVPLKELSGREAEKVGRDALARMTAARKRSQRGKGGERHEEPRD